MQQCNLTSTAMIERADFVLSPGTTKASGTSRVDIYIECIRYIYIYFTSRFSVFPFVSAPCIRMKCYPFRIFKG